MFAIDNDLFGILIFSLEQTVQQKLHGLERFAITANQATAFFGINLERQIAAFISGFLDLDDETEITENGVEQFLRRHHRFRFPAGATFSSVGIGCLLF